MTVTGSGFQPGETVSGVMNSEPYQLGSKPADADGRVVFQWDLPADTTAGNHTVTLTGAQSGVITAQFTVELEGEPSPTATTSPSPQPSATSTESPSPQPSATTVVTATATASTSALPQSGPSQTVNLFGLLGLLAVGLGLACLRTAASRRRS